MIPARQSALFQCEYWLLDRFSNAGRRRLSAALWKCRVCAVAAPSEASSTPGFEKFGGRRNRLRVLAGAAPVVDALVVGQSRGLVSRPGLTAVLDGETGGMRVRMGLWCGHAKGANRDVGGSGHVDIASSRHTGAR